MQEDALIINGVITQRTFTSEDSSSEDSKTNFGRHTLIQRFFNEVGVALRFIKDNKWPGSSGIPRGSRENGITILCNMILK